MEVLNSSHATLQTSLCVIQLPPCTYSCPVCLTGTTGTPDHCNGSRCYDLTAGGHQCICNEGWWGVGQDRVIVSLKIVAEIPTYVIITGDAFGMKVYQLTIRAVTAILVGIIQ